MVKWRNGEIINERIYFMLNKIFTILALTTDILAFVSTHVITSRFSVSIETTENVCVF